MNPPTGHNPDILTCLANLSADEVFTPPKLANAMLDLLPPELFRDPKTTFLDPVCKSGVFLREIARRLNEGLKDQIKDDQARIDHILTKQVFGLAITELTSLLSRRSLYCSKKADGRLSIARGFKKPDGNVLLPKTSHTWEETKCKFCGAPKAIFDREEDLEQYAYPFIHLNGPQVRALFGGDMKFDVIIGNPPYQMKGGAGGTSDSSIYHLFVEQALKLEPRYLTMVIPSRWLAGGRGLDEFRRAMLGDRHMRAFVDYPAAMDVFPGVEIKAGVCYFLRDSRYDGDCQVTTIRGEDVSGPTARNLGDYDIFVRDAKAVSILEKVLKHKEDSINKILTRDTAFGLASNFSGFHEVEKAGDIPIYFIKLMKRGIGFVGRQAITKNEQLIDRWKVLVPEAYNGGDGLPHQILGKPEIAPSPSACTQSYLAFYVDSEKQAKSLKSYYMTRLFRFLISQRKITQHALHSTYNWVPIQKWDRAWSDHLLYAKYGITTAEVSYIESMIRPMEGAE